MSLRTPSPLRRRLRHPGCLWSTLLLALLLGIGVALTILTRYQMGTMHPTAHHVAPVPGSFAHAEASTTPPLELHLDLSVAQLQIRPAEPGAGFEVRAEFDENHYRLSVDQEDARDPGQGLRYDLRFVPVSQTLSFLRMKMGEDPPRIYVRLPKNQPLRLFGKLTASFAAIEAGGLTLEELALEVEGGAATVSFLEPLTQPMESFSLVGDKGSIEVTGLGNASPRRVELDQRLGELDIDLRGNWTRDASIELSVFLAGGSCWLPDEVEVVGLPGSSLDLGVQGEGPPPPRLVFSLEERGGKLIFIH